MQISSFDRASEIKFEEFIKDHPFIIKAIKTVGEWDILLYIIADSPEDFHTTIKELKNEFSDVMRSSQTFAAYQEHAYVAMPAAILD